jgi:hypothetical protein
VLKNVKNGANDRDDRDSSFGRLLARSLSARGASAEEAARGATAEKDVCLDADTLAAWADDRLSRDERTAAEAHAADCARCQTLLAAMVKTAPSPVAVKPAWRLPALGWLVPLTAAAAAIIIWVTVPGHLPLQRGERPASAVAATNAPAASPPPANLDELKAQAQGRVGPPDESANRRIRSAAPAGPRRAGAEKQKAVPLEERTRNADDASRESNDTKLSLSADANAGSRAGARVVIGAAAAPNVAPKVEAAPSAAPSSASEPLALRPFARVLLAPTATMIVSPDPASRWRVVPSGAGSPGSRGSPGSPGTIVQRSTDGGSTWQTQETGVAATLTAGASPTPSVCWLVGPAGTVLLSTDGRSWQRLAFPEAANLASVTATDARTATVTATDGRKFSTTDGGLTWARSGL